MFLYKLSSWGYIIARVSVRAIVGKEKRNKIFREKRISPSSFMFKDFIVISNNNIKAAIRKNTMDYQTLFKRDEGIISEIKLLPNDTFVDIGANVGSYTLQLGSKYPNNKIISIEAHPEEFKALKRNIVDVNNMKNVVLVNMGVYSKKDELELYQQGIWTASSSAFVKSENAIKIPCDTLDNIFEQLKNNQKFTDEEILVIKMDIEGSEHDALLGATESLKKCKKIFIEVHYTDKLTREENLEQVKKILEQNNFSLEILQKGLRVIGTKI
ncbi:MAG: FkbM family methyltransferase [Candidatus Nitrosopumilus sp. bin_7KS]